MAQHFLLSTQARTLSLAKVLRLSDDEAFQAFKAIRWADNDGEPYCPKCGCVAVYEYASRRIFKCQGCEAQFSVTSSTIFASRKLAIRDLLAAIAIFCNGAKGHSALQLSRDLDVQYKTAFVLAHKLREAMASEMDDKKLSGIVEIDGAYFGGYVKPENVKAERVEIRGWVTPREHLEYYHRVDIALDTFPYHGCLTTLEGLWMGVPVISLRGDCYVSRVSDTILSRLDMAFFVATQREEVVRKAQALAGNTEALARIRPTLRQRMQASVLSDAKRFAGQVERAYREMWQAWVRSVGGEETVGSDQTVVEVR